MNVKKASVAALIADPGVIKGSPVAPKRLQDGTNLAIVDRKVTMSNALARGAQGLLLTQKRLIALALAKADTFKVDAAQTGGGWSVTLTATEYAEAYSVDLDTAYTQLRTGARSLLKTLWRTVEPLPKGKGVEETEGQWLSLAKYRKHEGRIEITFHQKVSPHLLSLRSQFVTYRLKQAVALRSVYAWRLMECVQSFQSGVWTVDVTEFAKIMEAPPSCVARYNNLYRTVILPALKDLREKAGINLELEITGKFGKKVTQLRFVRKANESKQGELPL